MIALKKKKERNEEENMTSKEREFRELKRT
jgi:hypothetical protein